MSALTPQTQPTTLPETFFFPHSIEEVGSCEEPCESRLQEGLLKTVSKSFQTATKEKAAQSFEMKELMHRCDATRKLFSHSNEKPSPYQVLTESSRPSPGVFHRPSEKQHDLSPTIRQKPAIPTPSQQSCAKMTHSSLARHPIVREQPHMASASLSAPQSRVEGHKELLANRPDRTNSPHKERENGILEKNWMQKETKEWWEMRYHHKERQREGEQREHRDQRQDDEEDGSIQKIASLDDPRGRSHFAHSEPLREIVGHKPVLAPPSLGVFALYYILTKIGIHSDGAAHFTYKKEIESIDAESTETHKKRIDELREMFKKEQETATWSIMSKVFSWMASFFAIMTGAALIATGVGAVAGAMIVAGGVIQLTSMILEISGGWKKIMELLPGDDAERKRAVITWMQIGIAVLCMILSGAGAILGGYAAFSEVLTKITLMVIGPITAMATGVTAIGVGISNFLYKNKIANVRQYERRLTQLKHQRKDLMEQVELGVDRLEQLFEDLARSLQFDEELFQADQMTLRR